MMQWRPVMGYRGFYEVSEFGDVRNRHGKQLKPVLNAYGYYQVTLSKRGNRKTIRIHQLVIRSFVRKGEKGEQVCHRDGVKTNNHVSNLRWGTARSNARDKIAHGTLKMGDLVPNAVLTDEKVRSIRDRYSAGEGIGAMAREFGVNYYTISNVVYRRSWKHVK